MGKTGRWFRRLLTGKKTGETNVSDTKPAPAKEKSKWSFVRSFKDKSSRAPVSQSVVNVDERKGSYREGSSYSFVDSDDQSKHAIAVAAATAAVAEAAVAAAQAAAAVVRLTSSGRCTTAYGGGNGGRMEDWAVVKIQATFRGYLARRALRALKGLVKLQALVRGHIVRKRTAEELRCLQALVRAQARARAGRAHLPETGHPIKQHPSLSHYNHHHHPSPATPEKYEHVIRSNSARHDQSSPLKRSGSRNNSRDAAIDHEMAHLGWNWWNRLVDERSWDHRREFSMKTGPADDEKSDKILEIDTGKPNFSSKRRNIHNLSQHTWASDRNSHSYTTMDSPSKDSTTAQQSNPSLSSGEVQSLSPLNFPQVVEDTVFSTAHNSPQFYSASSRPGSAKRGPFTPSKSDTRSFLSGYSDYPNYMANTESSKAKVRSHSAPKQRPEFEKSSSTKRLSVHGFGDMRSSAQKASTLHASFTSKAYPGSGRLDRLGMPIRGETIGFNDVYRKRY